MVKKKPYRANDLQDQTESLYLIYAAKYVYSLHLPQQQGENEELTALIKKLKGLLYDTTKREKPLGIKAKEM